MQKFVERFESDAFENNTIAKQINIDLKKNLQISPHPYCGWRSYPNQKLETITTNEKGLRSKSFQNIKHKNTQSRVTTLFIMVIAVSNLIGFQISENVKFSVFNEIQ